MQPRRLPSPELGRVRRQILRAYVIAAEQQLPPSVVEAPEWRRFLRRRDDGPATELPTPGSPFDSVPAAVSPPDRPLLLNRDHRGSKPQPSARCTAGVNRPGLP